MCVCECLSVCGVCVCVCVVSPCCVCVLFVLHLLSPVPFRQAELRSIVEKRRDFEYLLKRRTTRKADFLRAINYEVQLERLRKLRKVRPTGACAPCTLLLHLTPTPPHPLLLLPLPLPQRTGPFEHPQGVGVGFCGRAARALYF